MNVHIVPHRGAIMFEQSLVESTPLLCTTSRWPAVISVAIQSTVLALLLTVPLLHPGLLPLATPRMSVLAPPRPTPPTPKPIHVEATTASTPGITPNPAPPTHAPQLHTITDTTPAPDLITGLAMDTGNTSPFASLLTSGPAGPHVTGHGSSSSENPSTTTHPGPPLAISTGVSLGLLLTPIRPEYPAIARLTRTEGTVVVQAIISKSGHIESAHILSGPTVLQSAALEAVRNARYRPYLLNNQPTEVETTISITFHLSS